MRIIFESWAITIYLLKYSNRVLINIINLLSETKMSFRGFHFLVLPPPPPLHSEDDEQSEVEDQTLRQPLKA